MMLEWGSRQIGPRYFGFFAILFTNYGGASLHLIHAIVAFANIFL